MTVPHVPETPEPVSRTRQAAVPQGRGEPEVDTAATRASRASRATAPQTPGTAAPGLRNGLVREARPEDLTSIGAVHAASMLASLEAGHRSTHGTGLPAGVRAMVSAPVVATGWQEAVTSPPSREHHVLVATQDGTVVGLLGLAPTRSVSGRAPGPSSPEDGERGHLGAGTSALAPTGTVMPQGSPTPGYPRAPGDQEPLPAAEMTALGVDPSHQHRGHGSRLLAAAADTARSHGARALVVWAVRGDESLSRFLRSAGLEPTGAQRQLSVGQGITEDCWVAAL